MNNCAFTIVTPNFLERGLAALQSMKKHNKNSDFYVFCMDYNKPRFNFRNIKIVNLEKVENYERIAQKHGILSDATRWTLKPFVIIDLLKKYDKVIYIDPDIYFINKWDFLFEEIDGMLLTRHWRPFKGGIPQFNLNFTDGFFNAGFIGASKKSIDALKWWGESSLWRCDRNKAEGRFVDQRYLDFIYIHFPNIKYIKHQGCNLASWNLIELKRKFVDKKIIINDKFEGVFLHFSCLSPEDKGLVYYFNKYKKMAHKIKSFNFNKKNIFKF